MRKFGIFLFCLLLLASMQGSADTYTLVDGTKISGKPIAENDIGVVFKTDDDTDLGRVAWEKISQESLRKLMDQVKTPRDRALIVSLLDEPEQIPEKPKDIVVKPIQTPERPHIGIGLMAIFGSPVGLFVLLVLYCGNLWAAYEVALYRRQPAGAVCGLAAIPFVGIFSPIYFLSQPSRVILIDGQAPLEMQTRFQAIAPPSDAPAPEEPVPPTEEELKAAAALQAPAPPPPIPQPIVFKRGDFFFNRRFFETKLAGFLRVVPTEAEKDMVVYVQSARGNFTGRKITSITATDLNLQVFKDGATADEMIPFTEISEVQIRHKDSA